MNQTIDPIKLKAAAEHLEWVLKQYPESDDVQSLLHSLTPLLEDAKTGMVTETRDRIPGDWNFADGRYIPYQSPSVDAAFSDFATEMRAGWTEEERQLIAGLEAKRKKFEGSQP
ncbi:hypothetical protein [Frateuria defendens]|uniref:hypothetical protein n=1 Tax=Frateuria defendens TaxID=2219559 RepID=UPI00066FB995|nr:hypothetical protein [Frateuria defendens]